MRPISLVALPILLLTVDAHAALPPPSIEGPRPTEPTVLEVDSVTVDIECTQAGGFGLHCRVLASYSVVNPTNDAVTVGLEVYGVRSDDISVDDVHVDITDGKVELSVEPGATRRLTATTLIGLHPQRMNMFLVFEPTKVRHPWLGGWSGSGYFPGLELPYAPENAWGRVGDAIYTARYPSKWSEIPGWQHRDEGDQRIATKTGPATKSEYFSPRLSTPAWKLVNGGPYIELGGTFDTGFRARVGYEVGLRTWLLTSLAVGSDLDEDVIVTPLVEAASPSVVFVPSFGIGLGAPVRVLPDTAVGIRLQLVATWLLGFVTTFDYWPSDDVWRTTLSARIGI